MIFLSYWFIAFALIVLPLYWALRAPRLRLAVLIVASVVSHGHFAGPAGVAPILVLGVATYFIGRTRNPRLCVYGMVGCVLALVFYKYAQFLALQVLGAISGPVGQEAARGLRFVLPEAPPLAISFFVFEFVHYLFDVRRGTAPILNPLHFGLFSLFWPSIVAGPIKRYEEFVPSVMRGITDVNVDDVPHGFLRVLTGLVKKTLADNLTIWIDAAGAYSVVHEA